MPRLFGTDGVRGLANRELTADLALGLAQAAAAVLTRGRHADELRAAGRRPVAVVARDPRVSGEFLTAAVSAGLASSGVDVLDAGVHPDAGDGIPHRLDPRRLRRDDLGVAQPGARQRHQVLLLRRHEAPRRGRRPHRVLPRQAEARPDRRRRRPHPPLRRRRGPLRRAPARHAAESPRRPPRRARLRPRRCRRRLARDVPRRGRDRHRDRSGPRRHEHQRRGGLHAPRATAGRRARARRRPRHRPRRRRRSLPRGRRRRQHRRRRQDHGDPRCVDARSGSAHRRHARRDGDVEPGPAPGDGRARHPSHRDQGRRPLRARGARGRGARARRRAVGARHHDGVRDHRRRRAHRPSPRCGDGAHRESRSPSSPR